MPSKRLYYGINTLPKNKHQATQIESLKAHQVNRWGEVAISKSLLNKYHKPALNRIVKYKQYKKVRSPQLREMYQGYNLDDKYFMDIINREWRENHPRKVKVPHPTHDFLQQEVDETQYEPFGYLETLKEMDSGLDEVLAEVRAKIALIDNQSVEMDELEQLMGELSPDIDAMLEGMRNHISNKVIANDVVLMQPSIQDLIPPTPSTQVYENELETINNNIKHQLLEGIGPLLSDYPGVSNEEKHHLVETVLNQLTGHVFDQQEESFDEWVIKEARKLSQGALDAVLKANKFPRSNKELKAILFSLAAYTLKNYTIVEEDAELSDVDLG